MQVTQDLSQTRLKDLLRLHGAILRELVRRGICTTNDNPIGGYGEWLVARAFGGERQPNSNKSFDVLTTDRIRLQVKTRWLPLGTESRQLSAVRSLDQHGFDYIVAVVLDKDFAVAEAYQIPHGAVGRLATLYGHTNSHRLVLSPKVCRDAECLDITVKLRLADDEQPVATARGS